jgi:hypothetical protein
VKVREKDKKRRHQSIKSQIESQKTTKAMNICNYGWIALEIMTMGLYPIRLQRERQTERDREIERETDSHSLSMLHHYPMTSIWEIGQIEIYDALSDYPLQRSLFIDQEQINFYIQRCLSPYKSFSLSSPDNSPLSPTHSSLSLLASAYHSLSDSIESLCIQCLQIDAKDRCEVESLGEIVRNAMMISMDHLTLLPLSQQLQLTDRERDREGEREGLLLPEYISPADDGAGCLAPALWDEPAINLHMTRESMKMGIMSDKSDRHRDRDRDRDTLKESKTKKKIQFNSPLFHQVTFTL